MPDLNFQVVAAEPQPFAASPLLVFKLAVVNAVSEEPIHTIALQCQVQIEATRRRYSEHDQECLIDLFGKPERWSRTLRTILWTHANVVVSRFEGNADVDLPVPCTFDFNVAAVKYFAGLEDGEVPLCLQFSGTVFYEAAGGTLQVAPIPWNREARFRLPVRVWQEMMDIYYPNTAWLCLRRDAFDRLYQYKRLHSLPTWEQALESLMPDLEVKSRT